MGVRNCDRLGCENILCDRYSPKYGYICNECFKELEALKPHHIHNFMGMPKSDKLKDELIDYDAIFPLGD